MLIRFGVFSKEGQLLYEHQVVDCHPILAEWFAATISKEYKPHEDEYFAWDYVDLPKKR